MRDRIVAVAGLILFAPTLAITAIAVALGIEVRPIVRRRLIVGEDRVSSCHQFRISPDGRAVKSVGTFLRRTNLHTLPILVNVARGEIRLLDLVFIDRKLI